MAGVGRRVERDANLRLRGWKKPRKWRARLDRRNSLGAPGAPLVRSSTGSEGEGRKKPGPGQSGGVRGCGSDPGL